MTFSVEVAEPVPQPAIKYVFHPMFSAHGKLLAFECLSRFSAAPANDNHFVERYFLHASEEERNAILLAQIELIEAHQHWFNDRGIIVTLNVDDYTLSLLEQTEVISRVKKIGCIHFEVHELSSRLFRHHKLHQLLASHYSLWLDDFGSGLAKMHMLSGYAFRFIKIDKHVFWKYWQDEQGQAQLASLLDELQQNQFKVVIEGIETIAQRQWLEDMPYYALQGRLWCEMSMEELKALPVANPA